MRSANTGGGCARVPWLIHHLCCRIHSGDCCISTASVSAVACQAYRAGEFGVAPDPVRNLCSTPTIRLTLNLEHALQRTAVGRRSCNRRALWPPSLSLIVRPPSNPQDRKHL